MLEQPISSLPTANSRQFKVGDGKLPSNWIANHWVGEADGYFWGSGLKTSTRGSSFSKQGQPQKTKRTGPEISSPERICGAPRFPGLKYHKGRLLQLFVCM